MTGEAGERADDDDRTLLETDLGVAPRTGWVCLNFEEHPREEVEMVDGPFDGVACPKCGRMTGGMDMQIEYTDEGVWK